MDQVDPGDKLLHISQQSIQETSCLQHRSEAHPGGRARDRAGSRHVCNAVPVRAEGPGLSLTVLLGLREVAWVCGWSGPLRPVGALRGVTVFSVLVSLAILNTTALLIV